ncbi:putative NADH-dependent flavin oxidoreductase YqiG [Nocardioides sp. OK12]|uniref:NADH:flavin oxidoreductase n=1 Tax=Nocardioides TaxID=1839 RepID=UPI0021C36191|nr:NADH:flavin oxidoreductase [Nocardioides sp. OK12]GHJ58532.1 putative NADH-dependent flavin oxidoreductase YqiG [Nocardioides sp. OK12]
MTSLQETLPLDRGPAWANRITLAPLTNLQSHADGSLSDDELDWLVARGEGGFAMVMTCAAHVSPEGQCWDGQLAVWDDRFLPGLTRLADALRATGTTSCVQLQHGGMRASQALSGHQPVAPWDDESKGARALTTAEVERVVQDFVDAAVRCERAGFDGVQVHGAHAYLLAQFLDARSNHRTDAYGGSPEARARVFHEVVDGIRAATGPDFQVGMRLTPERSGIAVAESTALAQQLMLSGALDHLDMSLWDVRKEPFETAYDGLLIDQFTALERGTTRLGVAGGIVSTSDAQWCLERGADFVTVGTAGILHHDFARRALEDPEFTMTSTPVSREHLRTERLGADFIEYLAAGWDFVG